MGYQCSLTKEDIAAYLTMMIKDGDAAEIAHAFGVAAHARGMSEVVKAAGITREALYKAPSQRQFPVQYH